ncbi:hypothetical protein BGX38DRAFT_423680 [Terfezia claveryi]|nr:hypothetical protein BGX38DRAFT_423680 [Terfezia claveryi]
MKLRRRDEDYTEKPTKRRWKERARFISDSKDESESKGQRHMKSLTSQRPSAGADRRLITIHAAADGKRPEYNDLVENLSPCTQLNDVTSTPMRPLKKEVEPDRERLVKRHESVGLKRKFQEGSPDNEKRSPTTQLPHPASGDGYFIDLNQGSLNHDPDPMELQNEKMKSDMLNQYFEDDMKAKKPIVLTRAALMSLLVQTLDNNIKAWKARASEIGFREARIKTLESENMRLKKRIQEIEGVGSF